jgi:hypothetical protein
VIGKAWGGIAVIRLRGEPIKPSPRLVATINDAVHLARMVLEKVERVASI